MSTTQDAMEAIRQAEAAVKAAGVALTPPEPKLETGEKCGPDSIAYAAPTCEVPNDEPELGGATSIAEAESFVKAKADAEEISDWFELYNQVVDNIQEDEDLTPQNKADAMASAAIDLKARLGTPAPEWEDDEDEMGDKSLGSKIKRALGFKATWTSAFINNLPDSSFAFIEPGGKKDADGKTAPRSKRHFPFKDASGKVDLPHLRNALARAPQSPFGDQAMGKLNAAAKTEGVGGRKETAPAGGIYSFKDTNGWRWLAIYSNNFKDRDGEMFPLASHKAYESVADQLQAYPDLWLWHTPGTRIGSGDFIAETDGFMLASGRYDAGYEHLGPVVAEKSASGEIGLSHGYKYNEARKEANGTINEYFTFEVTILPGHRASNPWHALGSWAEKEALTMLAPEKAAFIDSFLGKEKRETIERGLKAMSDKLAEGGVDWKEVSDVLTQPQQATAAPAAGVDAGAGAATAPAAAAAAPTAQAGDPEPKPEPKPEPEPGEPAPDPTPPEGEARLAKIEEAVKQMSDVVVALATDLKGLKQTDDDKLASAMELRRPEPNDPTARPSGREDNIADKAKVEEVTQDNKAAGAPTNPIQEYIDMMGGAPRGAQSPA